MFISSGIVHLDRLLEARMQERGHAEPLRIKEEM